MAKTNRSPRRVLILNGSPQGPKGNSAVLIKHIVKSVDPSLSPEVVHLADKGYSKSLGKKILEAAAVVFVTGTYWDSWGSPLQELLEKMTELEGHPQLMGKPCAVFVLMHSVGGKGILSRLQGVLSTMGFLIPPMSGMVYSLVSDIALKEGKTTHADDFWQIGDIHLIMQNVGRAVFSPIVWVTWPVDKKDPRRRWLK